MTLCNPRDGSPPGSSIPGILQARILEGGCHFLFQCMKVKSENEVTAQSSDSSRPHGLQPTRLLRPWDFPSKSTGVGCHCLLHRYTMLSHFSRVRLCAAQWMAAHQAPPSLGFSRQEHWSGLPFPSPVHESEK